MLALSEPFTHSTGAAVSGNRLGEIFAGIQTVILPGAERPTISVQYLRRLYASRAPELDLGTFVQSATILLSDDLGGFHFDVNGLVTEQQDDKTRTRRAQFAQTLSISHPVGKLTSLVRYGTSHSRWRTAMRLGIYGPHRIRCGKTSWSMWVLITD